MRRFLSFDCDGDRLAGTLDEADGSNGLLIVSGGNEIRAGGHAGQASLAAWAAAQGFPAFRYDRPGIGDSEGENRGFLHNAAPLAAAIAAFRSECPRLDRIVAFGNCDAATSLIFTDAGFDRLVIANPWLIEPTDEESSDAADNIPSAAAIRARYIARLKNPVRLARDVLGGSIDLAKFARGIARLREEEAPSPLAARAAAALAATVTPTDILIARGDATALAFQAGWKAPDFARARANPHVSLAEHATSSHSFSDDAAKAWLRANVKRALERA